MSNIQAIPVLLITKGNALKSGKMLHEYSHVQEGASVHVVIVSSPERGRVADPEIRVHAFHTYPNGVPEVD